MKPQTPRFKIDDQYSLQLFTLDRLEEMVDVVLASAKDSPYVYAEAKYEDVKEVVSQFTPSRDRTLILLIVEDRIVGFIAGMVNSHPLWSETKMATELVWWVHPDHRTNGIGVHLVGAFIEWAKSIGAQRVTMSSLNNEYMDQLDTFYTQLGFTLAEKAYLKEL